jgi:hypothetical protein
MTPQEKAKEIVYKFYDEIKYMERAKQCAMIAVDEIINSNPNNPLFSDKKTENGYTDMTPIDYWQQVKKEIENL